MRLIDADALVETMQADEPEVWLPDDAYSVGLHDQYLRDLTAIEASPTVGGWINVKDRLPDMGVKCVIYRDGKMSVARHIANNDWITQAFFTYPTHWMPLYEPPKDEKDECNR